GRSGLADGGELTRAPILRLPQIRLRLGSSPVQRHVPWVAQLNLSNTVVVADQTGRTHGRPGVDRLDTTDVPNYDREPGRIGVIAPDVEKHVVRRLARAHKRAAHPLSGADIMDGLAPRYVTVFRRLGIARRTPVQASSCSVKPLDVSSAEPGIDHLGAEANTEVRARF